jgi:two-component system chemotaxis response regulator CheB
MPQAAIQLAGAESLPIATLASRLSTIVYEEVDTGRVVPPAPLMVKETAVADMDADAIEDLDRPGRPSGFSCPDCHGVLFEIEEGGLRRYRCRVGHAWSPGSLMAEHDEAVEGALWMALRSLEEKAALIGELARGANATGRRLTAARFADQVVEVQRAADLIRRLLTGEAGPRIKPADEDPTESGGGA